MGCAQNPPHISSGLPSRAILKIFPSIPANIIHTCHVGFHVDFSSIETIVSCSSNLPSCKPKMWPHENSTILKSHGLWISCKHAPSCTCNTTQCECLTKLKLVIAHIQSVAYKTAILVCLKCNGHRLVGKPWSSS